MSGEKEPKLTVDFGLGAKASLEAKVSTEIPAQSTGRLLDALTDIIRPFSERRGLKADQIRVQREEVLIEIARRARQRLEIENQQISPLPNKFMVPFLEKASLEELDSVLIDRWTDLLASCSADPTSAHPRFVQILSEMTGSDAALLRLIALHCIDEVEDADLEETPFYFDPVEVRERLVDWCIKKEPASGDDVCNFIDGMFRYPGVSLKDVAMHEADTDNFWQSKKNLSPAFPNQVAPTLGILSSLQVISDHHLQISLGPFEVDIYYVCMTALGIELLTKCDSDVKERFSASHVSD
jgi:hypothetical protein